MRVNTILDLTSEQRDLAARYLCRCITVAVQGAAQRDALLVDYDDILECRQLPLSQPRWLNASEINDPVVREAHIQLLALLAQAMRKDPKCLVEAFLPEDEEAARIQEDWLNNKAAEYRLNQVIYNVAFNAAALPVGILYVGWQQRIRPVAVAKYRAEGSDLFLEAEEREPDVDYEEVPAEREEVESEGCLFRTPNPGDFYLYPANAIHIDPAKPGGALGVGERMLFTEDQLWDGIDDYGYEAAEVERLIAAGPTHTLDQDGDFKARNDASLGLDGLTADHADGYYECFLWRQRLPKRWDIPDRYRRGDVEILACPARQIVFRLALAQEDERPYLPFSILPKPERFLGTGLCQLLEQLYEEMTLHTRNAIDSADLTLAPALVSDEETYADYGKRRIYPGCWIPEKTPGSIRPLHWERNPLQGLELIQYLRSRAQGVVSASGQGQLDAKVRKSAEIQNVLGQTDAKFDLYLSNFQESLRDLFARIVALHAAHVDEAGEPFRDRMGRAGRITAAHFQGRFDYVPTGTSTTATPETRAKLTQAKQQVQLGYFAALVQNQNPAWAPLLWHGARQMLLDLYERRPESWLGPEPQPRQDAASLLQAIAQQLGPQVVQQLLANAQSGAEHGLAVTQTAMGAGE
jgi:hypothetical protein